MSAPAWADVPSPSSDEVVLHVSVQGDRTSNGTIGVPVGVTLDLVAAASPLTQSWAKCVVDAQGDCSFVVPVAEISAPVTYTLAVDASSPGWAVPPISGSSISVPASAAGGGVTINGPKLTLQRVNPPLPATCGMDGLKVAMVVDLSGSMDGYPLAQLKSAATGFVNAMGGTDTQIQLFTFASQAPANTNEDINRPLTSIQTQDGVDQVNGWINGWRVADYTNWDAGLSQVAFSGQRYDFVIFITDGVPNMTTKTSTPTGTEILTENVASANAIKATGARILVFGVNLGTGTTLDSAVQQIGIVSGTVSGKSDPAQNDYFLADWPTVAPLLLSLTDLCAPIIQTVNVRYVDDDAAGAVIAGAGKSLNGPSGSDVGFTEADAKAGVPANYVFASIDNVDTYDSDVSVDQTITVHVKHVVTAVDVPVTRTIHYVGSPSPLADQVQTVTWTRTTDQVTSVSSCATSSTGYPSVASPVVAGYQPDVVTVPALSVTSPMPTCPADTSVTVTYSPQTQLVNVVYVDDDAAGAVVPGAGKSLTGPSGSAVGFTEADAKAGVPANYLYVSFSNVATYDLDVSVDQTITVHVGHDHSTADVPVTRTIHYVGSPSAIADKVQTINWTRTTDLVANTSSCATTGTGYPLVVSPDVAGYLPDVATVPALSVTSPQAVCPADTSVTVTYAPQTQVVNVVYVDDDAAGAVVAGSGKSLTGPSGSAVGFTEADAKAGVPANYSFVSFTNVDVYDLDVSVDQTITVHVKHVMVSVDVPVTRTVHYTGAPSSLADNVATITWAQVTDQVTGTVVCSTASSEYPAVASPVVPGYDPDIATVAAAPVTSPVAVCPADSTVTVTYAAQTQTVNVVYVDDDAAGVVVAGAGKSLTGPSGSAVGFSEADAKAGVPGSYLFASLDNVASYDLDMSVVQTITVHVKHVMVLVDVPVTRTIHYTGAGSATPADAVWPVAWLRTTDAVTQDSWCSTNGAGYPEVKSPVVAGFTVDIPVVKGSTVTSPMDVCPADTIVTVTYAPVVVVTSGGSPAGSGAGPAVAICVVICAVAAMGLLNVRRRQTTLTQSR